MLTKIKQGLYSDTEIIFNGKIIHSHNEYLKYVSHYFEVNISNHHEITFLDINGKVLDSGLLVKIFDILYENIVNLQLFSVFELIEIYRL